MTVFHLLRNLARIALLTLLGATALPALAASLYSNEDNAIVKLAMATVQGSDLAYDIVASLTTEVGPRPAGSPNDARAVAWAKAKLTSLGFERVWTELVKVSAWTRGAAHADIV